MEMEWEKMDRETLQELYLQKEREITKALLNGADWNEVWKQRRELAGLAMVLHRVAASHPAEYHNRKVSGDKA